MNGKRVQDAAQLGREDQKSNSEEDSSGEENKVQPA